MKVEKCGNGMTIINNLGHSIMLDKDEMNELICDNSKVIEFIRNDFKVKKPLKETNVPTI